MPQGRNEVSLGDARPLYDQVYRALRTEIERGTLKPGDRLPSERAIGQRLDVSRVTVRRALEQLTTDGFVEGRRVASFGEPPNSLMSFNMVGTARGLNPTSRVLVAAVRDASIDEAELLALPPGAPIFELHRVRHLGGLPIAIDESHIPYERVEGIEKVDFTEASLYATLETRFGIIPTRADYVIEATGATSRAADLLDVDTGAPLLRAVETMYDQNDRAIDIGTITYRGDRYRFQATLWRRQS